MSLQLVNNMPFLKNIGMFQSYCRYLYSIEFPIDPLLWLVFSALAATVAGIGSWLVAGMALGLPEAPQLGVLFFVVLIDLMIGYPYIKAKQRIDAIEEELSDALRQMADTLRSGGTYEYALREVAQSEFGPLKKEMYEVIRKLEDGENFENSLRTLADNVDSRLVKRTITVIVDSVAAGAGLANVLEEIAEDVRESHRMNKERQARTVLQVIFMFAAGGFIAPMIFGFVSTISKVLINASVSAVSAEKAMEARDALGIIQMAIRAYIFMEAVATAIMISIMRDGKITKSIIYIPVLLCIAYVSYLVAGVVSGALVGVGK